VEMHEGQIEIRSPGTGLGADVEIRLPTIVGPVATVAVTEPPLVAPWRNLRVLIVEDNVDAADMLELRCQISATLPGCLTMARPRSRQPPHSHLT
jgi:hypothetical protein